MDFVVNEQILTAKIVLRPPFGEPPPLSGCKISRLVL